MLQAALVYKSEEYLRRNCIVEKLGGIGVAVKKYSLVKSVGYVDLAVVDIIVTVVDGVCKNELELVKASGKLNNKRTFMIGHQTSGPGWGILHDVAKRWKTHAPLPVKQGVPPVVVVPQPVASSLAPTTPDTSLYTSAPHPLPFAPTVGWQESMRRMTADLENERLVSSDLRAEVLRVSTENVKLREAVGQFWRIEQACARLEAMCDEYADKIDEYKKRITREESVRNKVIASSAARPSRTAPRLAKNPTAVGVWLPREERIPIIRKQFIEHLTKHGNARAEILSHSASGGATLKQMVLKDMLEEGVVAWERGRGYYLTGKNRRVKH